jgi:hypothetical protein
LALGAMAIATRMVAVTDFAAGRAGKDLSPQRLGTAAFDSAHGLAMAGQQVCGVFLTIGGSVLAEDVSQF